jgi:hypothetical protein
MVSLMSCWLLSLEKAASSKNLSDRDLLDWLGVICCGVLGVEDDCEEFALPSDPAASVS